MIGRRFAPLGLTLIALMLPGLLPGVGWAQPAAPSAGPDLGENIKQATNVQPFGNQIQAFVRDQIKALSGTDAAAQSIAREALARQVVPTTGNDPPTPAFLDYYANLLNEQLMPLAQNNDTRVRLNTAIVAAKVAQGANNARLLPVTQALLKDASDAVVLWALRAAKSILPSTIAGGNDALIASVVATGQARPSVIAHVYEALAINIGGQPANLQPKVAQAVVPAMQTVLQGRIDQYKSTIPRDPAADRMAAAYLTSSNEYRVQTAPQRVQTAQVLCDLLNVAAQRYADAGPQQRPHMIYLIRGIGGAISVIGMPGWENNPNVQALGKVVAGLPNNATPDQAAGAVAPIYDAMRGIQKFAKLNPPPRVGEMAANPDPGTPPPATASTGPSGQR